MPIANAIRFSKLIIDASVTVKWFSIEEHTQGARFIAEQAQTGKVLLFAPELLLYEVVNALWKGKKFEHARLAAALDLLLESGVELLKLDRQLGLEAIRFMISYDLTFYDATYAGLASLMNIPLITTDAKLKAKAKEIEVLTLKDLKL